MDHDKAAHRIDIDRLATDAASVARANALVQQAGLPNELRKWLTDMTDDLNRRVRTQTMARKALAARLAQSPARP